MASTTCAKPGTGANECGAGIPKGAALNFNYLYYNGAVSFDNQIKELATTWAQAGIKLNLEGKAFGDVISAAATPCTAGTSVLGHRQLGRWLDLRAGLLPDR